MTYFCQVFVLLTAVIFLPHFQLYLFRCSCSNPYWRRESLRASCLLSPCPVYNQGTSPTPFALQPWFVYLWVSSAGLF